MKKRILSLLICLMFVFSMNLVVINASAADFEITPLIDYDNEKITITGVTPALYGQNVSIVIYAPEETISGMADVTDRLNPEPQYPLNVENIKKIKNVTADLEGNFEVSFNLADLTAGYYMVSASGGGYKKAVSKDSELIYFENVNSINTVTIPKFNDATANTVEPLIREKELLIGVDVAGDYENNKAVINNLFESIKADDYPEGYGDGEMYKIQDTFSAISIFRDMYAAESTAEIIEVLENNAGILGIDIENKDYTNNKKAVAQVFLNMIAEGEKKGSYVPRSMLNTREVFSQCMGVVAVNGSNAETATEILRKYGEILGIDMDDYDKQCKKYKSKEVNKAFVERSFDVPSDVVKAYEDGIKFLKDKSGSSGGGGGGGGGASSTPGKKPVEPEFEGITIGSDVIVQNLPKDEMPQKFNDIKNDHWAYTSVQTLAEMGIVEGFENGSFAPGDLVTREQFVKMLIVAGGYYNAELTADFTDVAADRWSSAYIASAVSRGIVSGYNDSTFKPAATLTRQDAAVMAYRFCNVMKKTITKSDFLSFADSAAVSDYAIEAVASLESSSVINGFEDETFRPMSTLTRAQAAKIIYEIIIK